MAWISTAPTTVKEDRIAGTKLRYVRKIRLGWHCSNNSRDRNLLVLNLKECDSSIAFGINPGDAGPSKVKAALQAKLCHALQKQTGLALLPQRSKRTALQELNCAMSSKSNLALLRQQKRLLKETNCAFLEANFALSNF
eukprot:symbB.v1.2.010969.t1/scaffold727.1/size198231/14